MSHTGVGWLAVAARGHGVTLCGVCDFSQKIAILMPFEYNFVYF